MKKIFAVRLIYLPQVMAVDIALKANAALLDAILEYLARRL